MSKPNNVGFLRFGLLLIWTVVGCNRLIYRSYINHYHSYIET
ncbi:hypothetical protein [Kordia periserrulae]|nr:hypothetical protein [Kordia periserrulae]